MLDMSKGGIMDDRAVTCMSWLYWSCFVKACAVLQFDAVASGSGL